MYRLGNQFLAGSGFAGDQYRSIANRDFRDHLQQLRNRSGMTNDLIKLKLAGEFFLELPIFVNKLMML